MQSMNIQERLEAFWAGERPDRIPYTIYSYEWQSVGSDPAWKPMYEAGLGVTFHVPSFRIIEHEVETIEQDYSENGKPAHRQTLRTPVGEVYATWEQGWHRKYFVETPEDYRVMRWIVEHSEVTADYESYNRMVNDLPTYGIPLPVIGRTPFQTILVDLVGLENFGVHLFEYEEELRKLYDSLLARFRQIVQIVAGGPGKFVSNLENFTAESLGPRRYKEFLMPVYEECFPILHAAGKIIGSHYDGRTSSCKTLIAQAPIDLLESFTTPPEGDMSLAEARAAWPDKLLWSNINVSCYNLPPAELKALVQQRVQDGAPDGTKLAFEVSEHRPLNWKESIPVVLEALNEN